MQTLEYYNFGVGEEKAMSGDIDWIQGLVLGLFFMCSYGFYQIGKDFTRQMNNHDRICDDLDRIEKKIDGIENGLDLYSIEKK
jgi:hypothetical protein